MAEPDAADLLGPDEAARLEDTHVLEHARPRQGPRGEQLGHRFRSAGEACDGVAPGRIGEGMEDVVEGGSSVSHGTNRTKLNRIRKFYPDRNRLENFNR